MQPELTNSVARLVRELGSDLVITDPDLMESYRRDAASVCVAGTPAIVARPRTTENVRAVMRLASELRMPVVPQGARTGLVGGANAIDGCIVLSFGPNGPGV